ncbi:hypothetical protein GCM10022233_23600 [Streptomyces shaanxiensis]|uniref:Uncharacterized protein n=1 Tax=Streptomyces shaanxiensis TaxID=653357 RepID=A0ABP7USY8_9ACTN
MPASGVSAAAIAARLSDVGLPTRVEEHDRYTSVQAEVPESLSADLWREVLEVVAEADRFGLLASPRAGTVVPYGPPGRRPPSLSLRPLTR